LPILPLVRNPGFLGPPQAARGVPSRRSIHREPIIQEPVPLVFLRRLESGEHFHLSQSLRRPNECEDRSRRIATLQVPVMTVVDARTKSLECWSKSPQQPHEFFIGRCRYGLHNAEPVEQLSFPSDPCAQQ
jgi:hypothetical protein